MTVFSHAQKFWQLTGLLTGLLFALPSQSANDNACLNELPAAHLAPLNIESKYNQNDPTRSTLKTEINAESEQLKADLYAYRRAVVEQADLIIALEGTDRTTALSCLYAMLDAWAIPGAMAHPEATKTGQAVRKWVVAAISTALFKLQETVPAFSAQPSHLLWLKTLADQIVLDYPRATSDQGDRMNNHDYWAAWAVISTSLVLGRDDRLLDWGYLVFDLAMMQVTIDDSSRFGWLPREIARGKLGLEYSNFALMPLVMIAAYAQPNGHPLTESQRFKLDRLISFTAQGLHDITPVADYFDGAQSAVRVDKMAWILPYLGSPLRAPSDSPAGKIYLSEQNNLDSYGPLGGNMRILFPVSWPPRPQAPSKPSISFQ